MATIETTIDFNRQLTVQTVVGEVTFEEIVNTVEKYYEGVPTKFILWDFSRASMKKVTSGQVAEMAAMSKQYFDRRTGGKTALVFSSDPDFGIGRMYEILHDVAESDIPHMAFRSKEAALQWLLE